MNHKWIVFPLCAVLAACGAADKTNKTDSVGNSGANSANSGNSGGGGNVVSSGDGFSDPRAATTEELQAAQTPAGAAAGLQSPAQTPAGAAAGLLSPPDIGKVADLTNIAGVVGQLLGDPAGNPLRALGSSQELAAAWQGAAGNMGPLLKAAVDSPCVSLTAAGLGFKGCVIPLQQSLVQGTVQIDGLMALREGGLHLDLSVLESFAAAAAANGALKIRLTGDLDADKSACKGSLGMDVNLDGNVAGRPVSMALKQGLALDLAFQADQAACATGGSVLASRQWSSRPEGKSSASLPDLAAKLDFGNCGQAMIAFSPKSLFGL